VIRTLSGLVLTLWLLLGATDLRALASVDSSTGQGRQPSEILEEFLAQERTAEDSPELPRPELPAAAALETLAAFDSLSAVAYVTALRGLYEYQARGFLHRSRVFNWQYYSSMVIFGIVHLLVLAGLGFSWMQFRRGWSDGLESEMELSAAGIKIRSSVLGVIILVVSLAFFYLYLVYVYPIAEII
jgi:hypothetical protein